MAQVSRRYVGNGRASQMLYILAELPPEYEKPVDEYWLRVAQTFKAFPITLCSGKDLKGFVDLRKDEAESVFSAGLALFDNVNWCTLAEQICTSKSMDVSARNFFTSRAQNGKRV